MKKIGKNKYIVSLLQANTVNRNGRLYPTEVLEDMKKQFVELNHPVYGQLGYPEELNTSLSKTSHKINKIFVSVGKVPRKEKKRLKKLGLYKKVKNSEPILWGEIELTNKTPDGKLAKQLIKDLVARPRGMGSVDKNGVIQSDYKIISFDLISKADDSFKNIL